MEFLGARKGRTVESASKVQHTHREVHVRSDPRYRKSGPRDDEYFDPRPGDAATPALREKLIVLFVGELFT